MPILKKHILIFLFLFFLFTKGSAQFFLGDGWGFNVGAVFAMGNKFQRIGFTVQGYYFYKFAQVNAEARFYHNVKNLGPKKNYNEAVVSGGVVLAYGKLKNVHNPFLSNVSNQTGYRNSVGYSYNAYFNKVKTKQQTGILSLQFGNVTVIGENDILARPRFDRFRTGAFLIQYQYKNQLQFAVNCTMWTGQMGKRTENSNFPYGCYMDTTEGLYANSSHGLLSGQVKMALDGGQFVQANIGIDAEQVRNFMQNKLIHDFIFIPKKWMKRVNCHIPMIDSKGEQYLMKPEQKIRKPELYWNIFSSPATFY